jgi:methyl coenzyme M reductase gamma subunit
MTKKELIEKLKDIPDDEIIRILHSEDALGYYDYEPISDLCLEECSYSDNSDQCHTLISNYQGDKTKKVYVIS